MNYLLLPGGKIESIETKNRHSEKPGGMAGEGDASGNKGFEKPLHILGNLEDHIHAQGWKNGQNKPEKTLGSHHHLHFKLCADRK